MGQTIAQKVIADHSDATDVDPGDLVDVTPDWILANDLSMYRGMERMDDLGYGRIADPDRAIIAFDHHVPSSDPTITTHMNEMRKWLTEQNVEHFYDSGEGILHNIVAENGYALPGQLIIGSDSHTTTHGAFGMLSTGISHTDLGQALGSGELWLKVPETRRVVVDEELPDGTSAKDLGLAIMGELTASKAIYDTIEYYGAGIEALQMHERQTLTNFAVELGAQAGIIPADDVTESYLKGRARESYEPVEADEDAEYTATHELEGGDIEPLVAMPSAVDNVGTVAENVGTTVDQVFVGTCNNGRFEDIQAFADVLGNDSVAKHTKLIVVPGSKQAYKRMNEEGITNQIMDAGGVVNAPGCGPCFGAHGGLLGEGDTCVGTMNRNFPGRMGPGEIYISSPETAAASAMYGEITDPREVV
ncbi:aconitase/3-isopropylmalate dehydratase large subunit family protein [Natronosalvus caseinilyticus]|uniref:aconitase/3-isopropylmalate dehydratase large subunit family protein n=1 Tax=Natronosalvus caseinilyticus TaxID=2953747 RepID=UPI0028A7D5D3|nr:aconitase/3-isopropylmalate dehydratase large subunit family protein [Natronosalvus caseinilyticus]